MKLNELKPTPGSNKSRMRVGRGIGTGKGKTSGRGHKGQKARTGVAIKGFEGGQMPLDRRLPKFGFRNTAFATKLSELTLGRLQDAIDAKKIDAKKALDEDALVAAGVVSKKNDGIKLIVKGELKAKVDLTLTKASKGAQAAVEKAGGKITFIEQKIKGPKEGKTAKTK